MCWFNDVMHGVRIVRENRARWCANGSHGTHVGRICRRVRTFVILLLSPFQLILFVFLLLNFAALVSLLDFIRFYLLNFAVIYARRVACHPCCVFVSYTVVCCDVYAMPQTGSAVSVESVDPVFQTQMQEMLGRVNR